MKLPYDVMRCFGITDVPPYTACERRESCARYRNRYDYGPHTPFTDLACVWDGKTFEDHHIKDDSVSS